MEGLEFQKSSFEATMNSQQLYIFPEMIYNPEINRTSTFYPRATTLGAGCTIIIFITLGTFGNLMTILAFSTSSLLRKSKITPLIISLSVSDLIFCTFNLPLKAFVYISERLPFEDTFCMWFPYTFYVNVGISILSITCIVINRYVMLNRFAIYDRMYSTPYIELMIAFSWLFPTILLSPTLLEKWGKFGYDNQELSCNIITKDGKNPKSFLFIFGFIVPCFAIVLAYSRIIQKQGRSLLIIKIFRRMFRRLIRRCRKCIRNRKPNETPGITESMPSMSVKSETRIDLAEMRLTVLMMVIFTYFICFLFCLMILKVVDKDVKLPVLHVVAMILVFSSACMNPVIYVFVNRDYREAYFRIFRLCCFPCRQLLKRSPPVSVPENKKVEEKQEVQSHADTRV